MGKMNICLVDDDDWFREMFSQYLMCTCRNVSIFSQDFQSWKKGLDQENDEEAEDFGLFVFDGGCCGALAELKSVSAVERAAEKALFLCRREDEYGKIRELFPDADTADKYVSASSILTRMNQILAERKTGYQIMSDNSSFFVISVTSAAGGLGKTSLSIVIARLLHQKKNKKVLLVNTSITYDLHNYYPADQDASLRTLNEYIYYLFAGTNPESSLASYLVTDAYGVSSFYMKKGISELAALNADEMERFLDSIRRSGMFDVVIFDLDNSNDNVTGMIASRSDVVLLLSPPESDAEAQTELWKANIIQNAPDEPENIHVIVGMDGRNQESISFFQDYVNEADGPKYGDGIRIPYDPNSFYFSEGQRRISMTGGLAAAADRLLKEVIGIV